jgi:hypothetical protein
MWAYLYFPIHVNSSRSHAIPANFPIRRQGTRLTSAVLGLKYYFLIVYLTTLSIFHLRRSGKGTTQSTESSSVDRFNTFLPPVHICVFPSSLIIMFTKKVCSENLPPRSALRSSSHRPQVAAGESSSDKERQVCASFTYHPCPQQSKDDHSQPPIHDHY